MEPLSAPMTGGLRPEILKAFHEKECAAPVVGITGGKGGAGKTTVSVNLACALADKGWHVALVDADVDAPNAAILLSMPLENVSEVYLSQPYPFQQQFRATFFLEFPGGAPGTEQIATI